MIEFSFLLLSPYNTRSTETIIMFLITRFPIFFIYMYVYNNTASSYSIYFHSNCAKYSRNLLVALSTRFLLLSSSLASFRRLSRWSDSFSSSSLLSMRRFSLSLANPFSFRPFVRSANRPAERSQQCCSLVTVYLSRQRGAAFEQSEGV